MNRSAHRAVCVWPKCPKTIDITCPNTKLCTTHLLIVVNDYRIKWGSFPEIARAAGWSIDPPITTIPVGTKPKVEKLGIVYFLQVGGHIKIGWTSDLAKRMRAYPPNAVLLATQPGERKDELKLHKTFAVHRSHGREWYPLAPVILAHIKRVVAEYGRPIDVDFGAKAVEVPRPRQRQYIGGDRIGSGSSPRTVRG